MWPTLPTARLSPRPAPAAWPRSTPSTGSKSRRTRKPTLPPPGPDRGARPTMEREVLEFDVQWIGAGPAGLAGAIHLADLIAKHDASVNAGAPGNKLGE